MPTLKEILKERLLSQTDISEFTGLSRSAVNRAVQGYPIQRTTLLMICRELNIDPSVVTDVNVYSRAAQIAERRRL